MQDAVIDCPATRVHRKQWFRVAGKNSNFFPGILTRTLSECEPQPLPAAR
jgi:hypothetical protein